MNSFLELEIYFKKICDSIFCLFNKLEDFFNVIVGFSEKNAAKNNFLQIYSKPHKTLPGRDAEISVLITELTTIIM